MPPQHSDERMPLTTVENYGSTSSEEMFDKMGVPPPPPPVLIKTQSSFLEDAREFRPGSIPHSIVLSIAIGALCGTAAFLYYAGLEFMLEYTWKTLPEQIFGENNRWAVFWIPAVGFLMALGVGCTVRFMGEPGDLPYTIRCVHEKAYISMDHVLPMVAASQFSIVGGGSLGPEAPLVAISAALGGFVSRWVFAVTDRNLVRKHTLMGMAGALAAFFGCPLGGSLFALEVNSLFGVEYFEHMLESILCGEVCLAVFRTLANLPIRPIWDFTDNPGSFKVLEHLSESSPLEVGYGAIIGLVGAAIAGTFAFCHSHVLNLFRSAGLLESSKQAIPRAMLGCVVVVTLGMLIPHTLFWGEFEIQTIATQAPASTLTHVWPTGGLLSFEMDSCFKAFLVGVAKLIAISFTVAGGYRGGYIFPAFAAGMAFGRVVYYIFPFIPVQLCTLCMAAALNVGLTRTALATTLILAYLSNEQSSISPVLAASLVALFATGYMPFIPSQMVRSDVEDALYHSQNAPEVDDAEMLKEAHSEGLTPFSFSSRKKAPPPSPAKNEITV